MDPKSQQQKKMAEKGTRPSIRRCCLSHVAQHTTRALASGKNRRSVSRKRWSCKSRESLSGKEPTDQTYLEINCFRWKCSKETSVEKDLKQSWKMIYMNETARRSLMNFGDNVNNIDLDFYIYINLVRLETFSSSFV